MQIVKNIYVTVRITLHRLIEDEKERTGKESKITVYLVIFPVTVIIYFYTSNLREKGLIVTHL